MVKVFLTGGDKVGWALDNDLELTRRALGGVVEFSGLAECNVVHSVWWEALRDIPEQSLAGKRIICNMSGEPFRYLAVNGFSRVAGKVGHWIAQSRQAKEQLSAIGLGSTLIPYTVDSDVFNPVRDVDALSELRARWGIPADRYVIGNFHRDTEGADLASPKLMKGPDIFLEIMRALHARGHRIHVLLAGPRRHWMRRSLDDAGIPYTFIGEAVWDGDDMVANLLPQRVLNDLYKLVDSYVVSSRSEGGPRSILEAASSMCKVVSTPVGLAPDVLEAGCIYSSVDRAAGILEKDIADGHLGDTVEPQYRRIMEKHRPASVAPIFEALYGNTGGIRPMEAVRLDGAREPRPGPLAPFNILRRVFSGTDRTSVSLWHKFVAPPFGGGNQFMLVLRKYLQGSGVRVVENRIGAGIDGYVLNAVRFDIERFRRYGRKRSLNVVHRIDGPISLIRGRDKELDDLCFELNSEFASATVIQSAWTYARITEMGYRPVNPVIIHNGVDPEIFNREGRGRFDPSRKIRLISTSWSDNPRKGGPTYKWLDRNLDWSRYEYTFVGNCSERFERIRQIPPVPSEQLADILRGHDIYITASRNDPCSNSLIEALACGLPALYLKDGGHPELVGYGGLPFEREEEILPQLERLAGNYEMFQNVISVPKMEDVAARYLGLLKGGQGNA